MSQYTVGQTLPDGSTVVADDFVTNVDGSTFEQMTDSNGNGLNIASPSPASVTNQQAVQSASANLQNLVAQMAPSLAQAQTDLATLGASSDALAPILTRAIQGIVTLTQGLADALVALEVIASSELAR